MKQGVVRIIGGKWRGRRLKVPDISGLRPTPDRVRETLFNWLAPVIHHAHCLDLFAGTGALGFEALSRGAQSVELVDEAYAVIQLLKAEKQFFDPERITIHRAKIPEGLPTPEKRFDIIFLDPPYAANLLLPTCSYLEANHFLSESAYIYLEAKELINDNDLPSSWRIIKNGRAGSVFYHLAYREFKQHGK